ncbi:MAG TPA: hemerythrin domain-containing protein [Pseudolabrys sp.]
MPNAKTAKPVDAIALLKADHRKVEELFKELGSARKRERKVELAQMICTEVTVHALAEEKIFYPALYKAFDKTDDKLLDEAEVEHASIKELIAKIDGCSPEDKLFDAHLTVLKEFVAHHVKEEESEMMPKAKKAGIDLAALGEAIVALKAKLKPALDKAAAAAPAAQVEVPRLAA